LSDAGAAACDTRATGVLQVSEGRSGVRGHLNRPVSSAVVEQIPGAALRAPGGDIRHALNFPRGNMAVCEMSPSSAGMGAPANRLRTECEPVLDFAAVHPAVATSSSKAH